MQLPCRYTPFDLIEWHPNVIEWDIREKALPYHDAILCRHVLNHFSDEEVVKTLGLLKQSCKYLIGTSGKPKERAAVGHFYDYDFINGPIKIGEPLESIEEYRGLLCLWRIGGQPG